MFTFSIIFFSWNQKINLQTYNLNFLCDVRHEILAFDWLKIILKKLDMAARKTSYKKTFLPKVNHSNYLGLLPKIFFNSLKSKALSLVQSVATGLHTLMLAIKHSFCEFENSFSKKVFILQKLLLCSKRTYDFCLFILKGIRLFLAYQVRKLIQ